VLDPHLQSRGRLAGDKAIESRNRPTANVQNDRQLRRLSCLASPIWPQLPHAKSRRSSATVLCAANFHDERPRSPAATCNGLWLRIQRSINPTHSKLQRGVAVRCICLVVRENGAGPAPCARATRASPAPRRQRDRKAKGKGGGRRPPAISTGLPREPKAFTGRVQQRIESALRFVPANSILWWLGVSFISHQ